MATGDKGFFDQVNEQKALANHEKTNELLERLVTQLGTLNENIVSVVAALEKKK